MAARLNRPAMQQAIKDLQSNSVAKIGFFGSAKYEDGTPVAYVATKQEFGFKHIPSRSFIRSTISEEKQVWADLMGKGVRAVLIGNGTIASVVEKVGAKAAGDMRKKIADIHSPPLSPVTLQLRKWKKGGQKITDKTVGWAASLVKKGIADTGGVSTKPLVDSRIMITSLTHIVEKE